MIVLRRFVVDRVPAIRGWSIAALLLMLLTVAFFPTIRDQPSIEDAMRDMPEALKATFGISDVVPISSPAGYLQGRLFSLTLPVALVAFAIGLGTRAIGGSEEDGDLELLLAQPVTRTRVAAERFGAVTALVAGLALLFTALLFAIGPFFGVLEDLPIGGLVAACAGSATLALLHGAIAFTVGAVSGRRGPAIGAAAAVAAGGYVLQGLLAAANAPGWTSWVSPWHWYLRTNMLVDGADPLALTLPLVLVAGLVALGTFSFDRRDLR